MITFLKILYNRAEVAKLYENTVIASIFCSM